MDQAVLATIASSVVALLSPYLKKAGDKFSESAGNAAWEKTNELFTAIKHKFDKTQSGKEALNDLLKTPDDSDIQAAVRVQLKKAMLADTDFAKQLALILKEAAEVGADNVFNIKIYGDVQKLVQMGNVYGDVTI